MDIKTMLTEATDNRQKDHAVLQVNTWDIPEYEVREAIVAFGYEYYDFWNGNVVITIHIYKKGGMR